VIDRDGFGLFNRVLMNFRFFLPAKLRPLIELLVRLDAKWFDSAEIWVVVRKSV
jgi:hypothetical protein